MGGTRQRPAAVLVALGAAVALGVGAGPGAALPAAEPLRISASVASETVYLGGTITFTTVVTNTSGGPMSDFQIGIGSIEGTQLVSMHSESGPCLADVGAVLCTVPSLAAGASLTATLVVKPLTAGVVHLNTFAGWTPEHPVSPLITVTVLVPTADVGVALFPTSARHRARKPFRVRLHVANGGPDPVPAAVRLTPSAGLEIVSTAPPLGCLDGHCQFPVLGAGVATDLGVVLRAAKPGRYRLSAAALPLVSSDPSAANDHAVLTVVVTAPPRRKRRHRRARHSP